MQNALGSSGLGHAGSPSASQQQQQQQLSRLCSEVTPDLRANPLAASLGGGSVDGGRSGAATPASSVTATQQVRPLLVVCCCKNGSQARTICVAFPGVYDVIYVVHAWNPCLSFGIVIC
jgi:hypothetical protein